MGWSQSVASVRAFSAKLYPPTQCVAHPRGAEHVVLQAGAAERNRALDGQPSVYAECRWRVVIEGTSTSRGPDPAPDVEVSVVVPVLNEEAHIGNSASTMLAQSFDGEIEFLFVD